MFLRVATLRICIELRTTMTIIAERVAKLLDENGISATVRIRGTNTFDPATSKAQRGSVTDHTVMITPPYRNSEGYKAPTLITSGKGLTGIANFELEFTVKAGIVIIIDSIHWTVISITPVRNNTGILYFEMEIESG